MSRSQFFSIIYCKEMKDHHHLIEIKHLYKSYSEGKGRLEILNDLNLSFTSHGLCSLLGNTGHRNKKD